MTLEQLIEKIWADINAGVYDSSLGLRPTEVFIDRNGDVAVSYPAGPDWESWELKVARP